MASPGDVDARGDAALRRVPLRRGPRHDVDRAAPQAVPRAGRQVQPRPRRRALGDPAPRDRVQRSGAAGRDGAGWPRRSGVPGGDPAAALWDLAVASNVPTRLADLAGHDGLLKRDDLPGAAHAAAERSPSTPVRSTRPICSAYSNVPTKENDHDAPKRSSSMQCARRSAGSAGHWPGFAPTICWPARCVPSSIAHRRSTRHRSTRSTPATPTAPAKTTATSAAWRCCWPACRPRSRRRPSTGCVAAASRRSSAASRTVAVGDADITIACGVESMTRAPWVMLKPSKAYPTTHEQLWNSALGWRMINPKMPGEWTISLGEGAEVLGRQVLDLTRRAGRVRHALAPERRGRVGGRPLRRRGRAGPRCSRWSATSASARIRRWSRWPS